VTAPEASPAGETVLATLRWQWLFYNVFTVWALAMAAGVLWGTYWLGNSVGLDLASFVKNLADWEALGLTWTITIGVLVAWAVGVVALGANFLAENWNFRLTWTSGPNGTVLRTTKGLFRIRQVDRDESRLRGVKLAQPLPWRWIGLTDTTVISTGLSWSASTVVPRGPVGDALRVAAAVLRDDRPLSVPLTAHPRAALRRRIGWAVLVTVGLTAALTLLPDPWWLVGLAALPVFVWFAVLAYRALGHAVAGVHLVVRSGLNRTLVALRRDAVIGWTFRQSVLQRRLGLMTVRATTAAGSGGYTAPDLATADAVALADRVVPGLLTRYLPDQRRGEMPDLHPTVGSKQRQHSTRPGN
jgi:putative membrane protein